MNGGLPLIHPETTAPTTTTTTVVIPPIEGPATLPPEQDDAL